MNQAALIQALRKQQAALAEFGTFAFRNDDLKEILSEAARVCAECLGVPFAKICEYRPEQNDLLVVAGCGWHADVVGYVVSRADESSTQGRAFVTGEPVILQDISKNNSYALPSFYAEHGIVSTADVLIKGKSGSWGVLEVDSPEPREFDEHDIVFLTGFANIVADAVIVSTRTASMQGAIEEMRDVIAEKDELLAERVSREQRLRELQAQLLHISRLNAMGQMTAAIAHELNQPLAAIANYMSAAKRTLDSADLDVAKLVLAKELIEKGHGQTLRAGKIIRNLRSIVEKGDGHKAEENIGTMVKDSLALVLYNTTDANISVNLEIDSSIPLVMVDKIQIQQILTNLIRNSTEAMLHASERTLTLVVELGQPGFANVTVRDTGPGMPPHVLERLFQPFNTSKGSGMGLGLMICQTLVEANGGRIWRLDDQTKGTGFRLSLPLAVPKAHLMAIASS